MSEFKPIPMIGIREHSGVSLELDEIEGRLVVQSVDDMGVAIDLFDLIGWLSQNKDLVMGLRETP